MRYIVAGLMVLTVAATSCGRSDEGRPPPTAAYAPSAGDVSSAPEVQQILKSAASQLEQAGSGHFDMAVQLNLEASAPTISFSYYGDFQVPGRSHGTIDGQLVRDSEIISIQGTTYSWTVSVGAFDKDWDATDRVPFFLDPVQIIAAALSTTGDFLLIGEDVLDGSPVYHLRGKNEPKVLSETGGVIEIEVWTGRDDSELKKVTVEGPADLGPEGGPILGEVAVGKTSVSATMKLSDFGKLVSIEDPLEPARPGDMRYGRAAAFSATVLQDGRVLVVGGSRNQEPDLLASAEIYDPITGTWSWAGNMSEARAAHTATLLDDGRVLIAAGVGSLERGELASSEIYDPATGGWSAAATMPVLRWGQMAILLPDGRVLVAGGSTSHDYVPGRSALVYDPATDTWSSTMNMVDERASFGATLLPQGAVLLVGGTMDLGKPGAHEPQALQSSEVYDPVAGEWSAVASMSVERSFPSVTLLEDGRVLAAGGAEFAGPGARYKSHASAEIYDPSSDTWSPASSLSRQRVGHWAARLADGRVMVVRGAGDDLDQPLDPPEIYDPSSDTWTSTGHMLEPRRQSEAVLLQDGKVLAIGGIGENDIPLTSAEIYDPATNTWILASAPTSP